MYQIILLQVLFSLLIKLSYQINYQGDATTYGGQIYGGACGFKSIWTQKNMNFKYGVAMNSRQYNNSLSCGTCVNIKYKNRNINAIVTDICPECKFGDLDLFTETYNEVIQEEPGRKQINWEFITCPDIISKDSIQLRIDEINYYWLSIQPENFKCQISSLFIYQNNNWIEMKRDDSTMMGLYFIYYNKVEVPFKLKITNIFGEEIITDDYYEIKNLFVLNKQFTCNDNYKEVIVTQSDYTNQLDYNNQLDCN
jgi:expansin (peptidoglycan-binding protein)